MEELSQHLRPDQIYDFPIYKLLNRHPVSTFGWTYDEEDEKIKVFLNVILTDMQWSFHWPPRRVEAGRQEGILIKAGLNGFGVGARQGRAKTADSLGGFIFLMACLDVRGYLVPLRGILLLSTLATQG